MDYSKIKPPGGKAVEEKVSFSMLKKINSSTLHSEAIKIAWKAVREIVALRLMGDRGCAVPHLHEATRYGLLNVLVKEKRQLIDKITQRRSTIHWSAPLENILPPHIKLDDFRAAHLVELVEGDSRELIQYHLKNTDLPSTTQKEGSEKKKCDVEVILHDVQHYKINEEQTETPVALAKHFEGVDSIERIYLITEVYVASSILMNVKMKTVALDNTTKESQYQWNSDSMMPIGFIFKKCDMSAGGILKYGAEVDRKKAIEYNWVAADEIDAKGKKGEKH